MIGWIVGLFVGLYLSDQPAWLAIGAFGSGFLAALGLLHWATVKGWTVYALKEGK